jgi:hypothetical protein
MSKFMDFCKGCGPMSKFMDLSGQQFGRLTAKNALQRGRDTRWLCVCECGEEKIIRRALLLKGLTKSCGCLNKELTIKRNLKHGKATRKLGNPEYRTWCKIKERCFNPKIKSYEDYGGRGITVCEAWVNSFETFLADMGPRPEGKYSIERKDFNGNYCPENCIWLPMSEQAGNKRSNVLIEFAGRKLYKAQWARLFGISNQTFQRLEKSMSMEKIAVKCAWICSTPRPRVTGANF